LRSVCPATASTAKNMAPSRWGVVDAGERAGEEFELDAAGLELGGQRHQLGGVAGEALELVDGEDDGRLGRGLLELVGQRECLLQLGPDLDAGTLDRRRRLSRRCPPVAGQ
jgi:hypothetical protein